MEISANETDHLAWWLTNSDPAVPPIRKQRTKDDVTGITV